MQGRNKPYTEEEIKHKKCVRCGRKAYGTWQACSDKRKHRPLCLDCDIELNKMVLKWMGFPDWESKIQSYENEVRQNGQMPNM